MAQSASAVMLVPSMLSSRKDGNASASPMK